MGDTIPVKQSRLETLRAYKEVYQGEEGMEPEERSQVPRQCCGAGHLKGRDSQCSLEEQNQKNEIVLKESTTSAYIKIVTAFVHT